MGILDQFKQIDRFWAPFELDVNKDGTVPSIDSAEVNGELVGTDTIYVRLREAAGQRFDAGGEPFVRFVGDLGSQDVEIRVPLSQLRALVEQMENGLAAEREASS